MKNKAVTVRFAPDLVAELQLIASSQGLTQADIVRNLVLEKFNRKHVPGKRGPKRRAEHAKTPA